MRKEARSFSGIVTEVTEENHGDPDAEKPVIKPGCWPDTLRTQVKRVTAVKLCLPRLHYIRNILNDGVVLHEIILQTYKTRDNINTC